MIPALIVLSALVLLVQIDSTEAGAGPTGSDL